MRERHRLQVLEKQSSRVNRRAGGEAEEVRGARSKAAQRATWPQAAQEENLVEGKQQASGCAWSRP